MMLASGDWGTEAATWPAALGGKAAITSVPWRSSDWRRDYGRYDGNVGSGFC
jgi:hypothetical protein